MLYFIISFLLFTGTPEKFWGVKFIKDSKGRVYTSYQGNPYNFAPIPSTENNWEPTVIATDVESIGSSSCAVLFFKKNLYNQLHMFFCAFNPFSPSYPSPYFTESVVSYNVSSLNLQKPKFILRNYRNFAIKDEITNNVYSWGPYVLEANGAVYYKSLSLHSFPSLPSYKQYVYEDGSWYGIVAIDTVGDVYMWELNMPTDPYIGPYPSSLTKAQNFPHKIETIYSMLYPGNYQVFLYKEKKTNKKYIMYRFPFVNSTFQNDFLPGYYKEIYVEGEITKVEAFTSTVCFVTDRKEGFCSFPHHKYWNTKSQNFFDFEKIPLNIPISKITPLSLDTVIILDTQKNLYLYNYNIYPNKGQLGVIAKNPILLETNVDDFVVATSNTENPQNVFYFLKKNTLYSSININKNKLFLNNSSKNEIYFTPPSKFERMAHINNNHEIGTYSTYWDEYFIKNKKTGEIFFAPWRGAFSNVTANSSFARKLNPSYYESFYGFLKKNEKLIFQEINLEYYKKYFSGIKKFILKRVNRYVLLDNKTLYLWGLNSHSHFGIPNADYYNFQEPLLYPISGVEDVQVGYSNATMIVLLSNGTVLCSGRNANGSCGQGHTNTVTAPQAVKINSGTELSNVKKIFLVSTTGFCALTTSDQLYCWGRNNKGQLCTNDYSDRYYATPITFYESGVPLQVKDVAGGGEFGSFSTAYYLLSNNKVVGCGDNTHGFLGTGAITPTQFATPQEILLPDDGIYSLSFAKDSACYIDSSKNVWCVGSEAGGKFASIEKLGYHVEPTSPILGNRYALKVKVIDDAMCFHTTTGNLYCAGNNKYGVGKHCSESLCNMNIEGTVTDFDINKKHGCVVSSGKVYCWGNNSNGQLGNGTFASSVVPQKINSNANFISVYTGVDHTCAITNVGALYCWGNNRYGQIGDGTNTDRSQPVLVDLGEKVVKMSLGETYSCAIAHPGSDSNLKSVFCWGTNFKEVNNGSTSGKYYPHIKIIPSSYNGFSYSNIALDIAGGDNHVCALLFNSGGGKNVKCWGKNEKLFQSSNFITEPKIMSSSSLVSKIATGNNVLCYLNENSIIIGCIGNTKEASLVY